MLPGNFPQRKKMKREEAVVRKEQSDKLTPAQVLAKLDATFGVGKGAARQRARLKKLTSQPPPEAVKVVETEVSKPVKKNKSTKAKSS